MYKDIDAWPDILFWDVDFLFLEELGRCLGCLSGIIKRGNGNSVYWFLSLCL